jgi:hypothetical protein
MAGANFGKYLGSRLDRKSTGLDVLESCNRLMRGRLGVESLSHFCEYRLTLADRCAGFRAC